MKKSLLVITALAMMMSSCSHDETLEMTSREAITFGDVFIENSTRAIDNSYGTLTPLGAFEVYGTITNSKNETANLFKQEKVTKNSEGWSYDRTHTQYWIPGNTYNFTAIADGNIPNITEVTLGTNEIPTAIVLKDASQQKDILLATSTPIAYTSGSKTVDFNFSHLMAKAKVTIKNEIETNNGYTYQVENVQINNAPATATYTIGTGWGAISGNYNLNFGHIVTQSLGSANNPSSTANSIHIASGESFGSNYERLLIPTEVATPEKKTNVEISFTCKLYKDNILIDNQPKTVSASVNLKAGYAYNFMIKLGNPGEPIMFSVLTVNGWGKDNGVETK